MNGKDKIWSEARQTGKDKDIIIEKKYAGCPKLMLFPRLWMMQEV